ncbi:16S rRNA (guanine(527)-N(7))-methyltransferase RsmG [Actinomyces sp.]|uniref:16S rRNA (guanine(527)-N(7))-methyltransferase RsmG n=1 Tax=Actinomyces sp. TaxID=29317 RepID=UPI0026DBC9C3|nr:16S rRNA (guanine(527)-N(7))-methyltransferase RsmG [Actinomyces sp.]MDO4900736.1 16S rRNA (guanine(527)-N(7))-methyltransferase RsmG [Actinomyces sp.]
MSDSDGPVVVPDAAAQVERPTAEMRSMFGPAFAAAEHFAQMLAEQGELRGLLGPRELPRLWTRHIINSAAVVPFLPDRGKVADIGSGAGFPGIVVALLRPDLDVVLVESMVRRTQWLDDVVTELDLDNVTVMRARAEEVRARYDAVTARAVANLTKLIRIASPLLRPGGCLLALKGARAEAEVADAKYVIKRARLEPAIVHEVVTSGEELTKVVQIRRPARR